MIAASPPWADGCDRGKAPMGVGSAEPGCRLDTAAASGGTTEALLRCGAGRACAERRACAQARRRRSQARARARRFCAPPHRTGRGTKAPSSRCCAVGLRALGPASGPAACRLDGPSTRPRPTCKAAWRGPPARLVSAARHVERSKPSETAAVELMQTKAVARLFFPHPLPGPSSAHGLSAACFGGGMGAGAHPAHLHLLYCIFCRFAMAAALRTQLGRATSSLVSLGAGPSQRCPCGLRCRYRSSGHSVPAAAAKKTSIVVKRPGKESGQRDQRDIRARLSPPPLVHYSTGPPLRDARAGPIHVLRCCPSPLPDEARPARLISILPSPNPPALRVSFSDDAANTTAKEEKTGTET